MFVLLMMLFAGCQKPSARVVLYCAQDQEFAEPLFGDFQALSGLTIGPKFDTEANKSVSLATELAAEKDRPRADVHWNNEILNTILLARRGLYEPYSSPAAAGYPDWTRPPARNWQAFAARARVLIINTDLVKAAVWPKSLLDLAKPEWKGRIAMAKPQFGTTATQAACLFEVLGTEPAKEFYRGLKSNGVQVVAGNKQVAVGVAAGKYAVGLTDTDDALIELYAGKPVAVLAADREGHPDHPRLGVLFIPNTVALVKGGPNSEGGRKLIDYLLSASTETKLAEGGGFQIPLNPQATAKLPAAVPLPAVVKRMAVDFEKAADAWDEMQAFLREEFGK